MYTLLSGLYKHLTQKEEYYVIILGLDNAGKTVRFGDGFGTEQFSLGNLYLDSTGLCSDEFMPRLERVFAYLLDTLGKDQVYI